ncbi:MAG: phage tail protein I [Synergistaceae bacterium]|nr:phage tail protein I [Synergistaceae bacterium]
MKDIYTLSLNDITPQNIIHDPQISSLVTALDPELQELSRDSLEPLILARIDELPEQVLDLLAWQLHADFYDLAGTLNMKREAVKGSILWHMHKGTQWAILEALRQIDISAQFVAWWEDGAAPYTFKLKAIVSGDFYRTIGRDTLQKNIRRAVYESKAARSYLAGLETYINFTEPSPLFVGIIPVLSGERTLGLGKPDAPGLTGIFAGSVRALQGERRVLLPHEGGISSRVYFAPISVENRDVNLGVDLDTMQELLQLFERRILSRIDNYELSMKALIDMNHSETTQKLEEIKDMLRWKGDDEAL